MLFLSKAGFFMLLLRISSSGADLYYSLKIKHFILWPSSLQIEVIESESTQMRKAWVLFSETYIWWKFSEKKKSKVEGDENWKKSGTEKGDVRERDKDKSGTLWHVL